MSQKHFSAAGFNKEAAAELIRLCEEVKSGAAKPRWVEIYSLCEEGEPAMTIRFDIDFDGGFKRLTW